MKYEIEVSDRAEAELGDSFDWYESRQAGLGNRFVDKVSSTLKRIADNPHLYPARYGDIHQALVKGFPFVIIYVVEGKRVFVESVFHTSRNPSSKFDP